MDLVPLVKEVIGTYASQGADLYLRDSPDKLVLDLDGQRIRSVLRNLIENAIKYSSREARPVEIFVQSHTTFATLTIQDHGPGIPLDDQAQIFEPFYRVDPSRTRDTGGYGLGLSLVKQIMVAHGGTIQLDSHVGSGSAFILTFPLT